MGGFGMASARYYREQAKLLFRWSLSTRDARKSAEYVQRATRYIDRARAVPEDGPGSALERALELFNERQIRGPGPLPTKQIDRDGAPE